MDKFEKHVRSVPYFKNVINEIDKNPRKCVSCGCVESVTNVILSYNGELLCDECAFKRFDDDYIPS